MGILADLGLSLPDEPDEACRMLLDRLLSDGLAHDDVALLIARLDAPPLTLDLVVPADPTSLVSVRRGLGRWLRAMGVRRRRCVRASGRLRRGVRERDRARVPAGRRPLRGARASARGPSF